MVNLLPNLQESTIIIIIYHDFLPTPRRGSHVKSGKTHTHSHQDTPLSPYTSQLQKNFKLLPRAWSNSEIICLRRMWGREC